MGKGSSQESGLAAFGAHSGPLDVVSSTNYNFEERGNL